MSRSESPTNREHNPLSRRRIAVYFAIVVILWLGIPMAATILYPKLSDRGSFGDVFGTVNALFSGLAFAGLIVAILQQAEELRYQREELALMREELRRSSDAQEKTEEALRKRLLFEESLAKKRLTLSLFDEWSSAEMQRARAEAEKYLNTNFMANGSLTTLAVNNRDVLAIYLRLARFFEKCVLLERFGEIDAQLLRKLIGSDVRSIHTTLLSFLSPDREQRQEFRELLATIKDASIAKGGA